MSQVPTQHIHVLPSVRASLAAAVGDEHLRVLAIRDGVALAPDGRMVDSVVAVVRISDGQVLTAVVPR